MRLGCCATTDPDVGRRLRLACCLGAVRSTFRPGGRQPGARSTHRPQVVVIPRLRHLGWPRMRGMASLCSHYARIAGEPAGHADQTGLPDPVWRSRRWPMGRRAAAVPGSWEHFKLALIYVLLNLSTKGCYASHVEAGRRLPLARLML